MDPTPSPVRALLQDLLGPRFEVRQEIGSGGFGQVFEVLDTHLESTVAAKVLRPSLLTRDGSTERFLREIRLLAELRHPNIIPILDVFRSDELIAYLMPLVAGPTLRHQLAAGGPLGLDEAIRLLGEVGGALDLAHRRGVIHRDLKPENILLSDGHAVLADFGIARTLVGNDAGGLTETGVVVGSPRYMSPEQVSGDQRIDQRSDLYALAAIAYEMIAGQPPFAADSTDSLLRQKLLAAPTSLQVVRATVPAALDRAILRGLAANPADRQATVAEFVRECGEAMRGTDQTPALAAGSPTRVGTAKRLGRLSRKRLAWLAVAFVVTIASLGAATWFMRSRGESIATLPEGQRAWFVIAEIETSPPDPELAGAIHSILQSQFEQSATMGVLTSDEVAAVLRSAAKPESSLVTRELAREIAIRAQAGGILSASVRRTPEGSVILLRAVTTDRDSLLASFSETLAHDSPVLPAVESMTTKLLSRLKPLSRMLATTKHAASTGATHTITQDLEAFQLKLQADEAFRRGDDREAIALLRQAVARDTAMIVAWNGLGLAYGNLGHRDSAIAVYERILRHPDRLSLVWRTFVEGALQSLSGEYALHLSSMERLARDPTRGPGTLPNLALALSYMGRYREAVEICQRELRAGHPFEEIIRQNLTFFWVALDEPDSAQAVADAIRDPERRNIGLLGVALARGQGAGIERNAQRLLSTHGILASSRECALTALAGREANRGQVEDGWRMLGRAAIETEQGQDLMILNRRYWSQALFILANGPMPTSMPPNPDRTGSMNSEIASGVEALLQGDPGRARGIAARLERRFSTRPGMLERIPALMRAWAAQIENRPSEVIEQASLVLADAGMNNFFPAKLPAARWLIGRAFESLAQPDSAAHHYRAALARTGPWETDQASAALIERPVRMRLVIAELRAGRPEVARKEREYLARTVDRPDAIAARELEEVDLLLGMGAQGDAPAASGRR